MKKQQGDVIIRSAAIPAGAKKVCRTRRGYVLAEGEATGHAHVIEETEGVEMYEFDGVLYLSVATPAVVTHEEHKGLALARGTYRVGFVREYDPWAEEADRVRRLAD